MSTPSIHPEETVPARCWHIWRNRRIYRVNTGPGLFVTGCAPCRTRWGALRAAHFRQARDGND